MRKFLSARQCNCCQKEHVNTKDYMCHNFKFCDKFIKLDQDEETKLFVNKCYTDTYQQLKAQYLRPFITYFYSRTDADGILGTGKMFLLSINHILKLFNNETFSSMLDIGSGDGNVTEKFKCIIDGDITCIETATKMIKSLQSKGFLITDRIEGEYDIVACLNVLDRCENPITMLKEMRLVKSKFIIISIVLPFCGFYIEGTKKLAQKEKVIEYNKCWEVNVTNLCELLIDLGFDIVKISRVPYLSEGSLTKEMHKLDTVIFVLS